MVDDQGRRTMDGGPSGDTFGGSDAKDPEEQETLARELGRELTEVFSQFVRGETDFAELSFLAYETLQDLHVIASGAYEVEYDDAGEDGVTEDGYDREDATEQQEDLAQEPASR